MWKTPCEAGNSGKLQISVSGCMQRGDVLFLKRRADGTYYLREKANATGTALLAAGLVALASSP